MAIFRNTSIHQPARPQLLPTCAQPGSRHLGDCRPRRAAEGCAQHGWSAADSGPRSYRAAREPAEWLSRCRQPPAPVNNNCYKMTVKTEILIPLLHNKFKELPPLPLPKCLHFFFLQIYTPMSFEQVYLLQEILMK